MGALDTFSLNPDTTKYDPCNAYWLGRCADLAYSEAPAVQAQTAQWGFDRFRFFDQHDSQGFVAGDDRMLVVAFRGTQPRVLRDWLSDANTQFCTGPWGRVLKGFQDGLAQVWPDLTQALVEFQDRAQSLWFTGHSLGAALATLAVGHLRAPPNDKPVYGLYTFGSPRVGDREFEQRFDTDFKASTFRFVNNNDIVTRVPGRATGCSHVGTFLYFDRNHVLHDDLSWWYRFLDGVQGSVDNLGHLEPDQIRDHSMEDGYLAGLAANIEVNPFAR